MSEVDAPEMTWSERAAERSPIVQRSKSKSVAQAKSIVQAARRLIDDKGPSFTTQDLIKEAGIALQTFYRYFPGKDQLWLAVISDLIDENCKEYKKQALVLEDPLDRVRFYVTAAVTSLETPTSRPGFVTAEHFRLQVIHPEEVSLATRPFTVLIEEEICDAVANGQLDVADPQYTAWLITQLVMAVFHHYECAGLHEPSDRVAERLWSFCQHGLGLPIAPPGG